jgi:diguanylate cyclase (GGDEF)-like protein
VRVLIVDDSRMARLMLRNAVESLGHETLEACDGQQAWDMLVQTGADVVVSDWMMPGLEGPELCRRVRAQQQDGSYTYFILLTTLGDRRFAMEGMEAGADDYLPKPLDVGELQLRLIAAERITQLHKELLERDKHLRYLAGTDPLTGLPNRTLFLNHLEQGLGRAERWARPVGVLFLDLDNFKVINDSLGHQGGDLLLVEIARRIRGCVRDNDTVARLGGDEFTVLVEEIEGEDEATALAERVAVTLRQPVRLGEREIFVSASVGVALSRPGKDGPESLLRNADMAMYQAKANGKARHAVFDQSMEARALARLELETDLRHALERNEFRVFYQPITALADGHIAEMEALIRWEHPTRGMISPDEFIPIAEETGLIVALGQWVLEEACRQGATWREAFPQEPPIMSVNLSGRQFQHPSLVADIGHVLLQSGLAPSALKLEITESVVMQDAEATIVALHELKQLGIQLAIDDFGTGYSSLSYLKRFRVDTLKVDRSFVNGLGEDSMDTAIVQSVVALAKALHMDVTAEGIETQAQRAELLALGCDRGQGYLFARPLPPAEMNVLLADHESRRWLRRVA